MPLSERTTIQELPSTLVGCISMHAPGTALILLGGVGPDFTASGVAIDAYMAGEIRNISLD